MQWPGIGLFYGQNISLIEKKTDKQPDMQLDNEKQISKFPINILDLKTAFDLPLYFKSFQLHNFY